MKKIMIVDDHAFIRQVLKKELTALGYDVVLAVDGVDCLNALKNMIAEIDLIVLDVMMPNMDGYDTCTAIRQDLKGEMPIVFLSSNSLKESIVKAIQCGGNEYIVKSPDSSKLMNKIEEFIGR